MLKRRTDKPVVGIFEASVWVGGMLVGGGVGRGEGEGKEGERERKGEEEGKKMGKGKEEEERQVFGIVSTGDVWKGILEDAIRGDILLGKGREGLFGGVETCGLDAGELHGHGEVEGRVKEAVGRLVRRDGGGKKGKVGVVVLGCAGMVGMEGWVREVVGEGVKVVDGVKAGVGVLQGLVRGGF